MGRRLYVVTLPVLMSVIAAATAWGLGNAKARNYQSPEWFRAALRGKGGLTARIDIEVIDVRESPPASVKKETLELPIDRSPDAMLHPSANAAQPEPVYNVDCHLAAISDIKSPFLASRWPYKIVRDRNANYYLLKGGISIHAWSAVDAHAALDRALPALKADLALRAARYREGLLTVGKKPQTPP